MPLVWGAASSRLRRAHPGPLAGVALALAAFTALARADSIIVDHTCTDVSQIPPYWLEQARLLTLHYAHTSHGSQLLSGAAVLEGLHPEYSIAVRESGTEGLPPPENPPALRIYDGNPPETYIEPGDYWATAAGLNRTRAVAATGHYGFSMWSWCGQQSSNSVATTQQYLDALAQLESEFPAMRFILMTGHTDGSGVSGTLHQRNEQVRAFAQSHGMVLFDFADIESYDPDGTGYLALGCNDNGDYSGGNWPGQWCAQHPGSELCAACSCAHSQPLICNLKGRALWWLMARLAGWPGPGQPALCRGDCNCDGAVGFADIDYFVAAIPDNSAAWAAMFPGGTPPPGCTFEHCDANADGTVGFADIDPFVGLIPSVCP